jgi:hypothetical protein
MSISSIGNASSLTTSLLSGVTSNINPFQFIDNTQSTSSAQKPAGGGLFASAIKDAFSKLGISIDASGGIASTSTASTASTSSSSDASTTATSDGSDNAVSAFIQSLFAALHAQSAPPPPSASDDEASTTAASSAASSTASSSPTSSTTSTDGSTQASAAAGPEKAHHSHGHHGHGGGGKIEGDLQSLIQQLTAADGSTTTDATTAATTDATGTTTATTATAASTTGSPLSQLEQSFNALLSQSGVTPTSSDPLKSFLESLAQNLHGAPSTGTVVSTEA